ncbi:hypothetical protein HMPREF0454_00580 [Hafnia alvei ATCC 51873]|uniref:Uncharacterized protein n=1 Tax=Hafnia alvei ATCC 51873 TaxID=1002364 RepID=G9Y1X1_HAFAL|nr:hypothetical protein HMPREF0454_00580 [Hafnia alvei ATCC 51873]
MPKIANWPHLFQQTLLLTRHSPSALYWFSLYNLCFAQPTA